MNETANREIVAHEVVNQTETANLLEAALHEETVTSAANQNLQGELVEQGEPVEKPKISRTAASEARRAALYAFDAEVWANHGCCAGVDEAGRGPLCGPVAVAACILDPSNPIAGIDDSKKISEKKRELLFEEIKEKALAYYIVFVDPETIDRENILWATMGGMQQAVEGLEITPNLVLVDGNRCPPNLAIPCEFVIKGDAKSASIAAASILAKVSRDRHMIALDAQYPQYGLAKHKGYGTKAHYEAIAEHGIQDFYRRSFLKKQGYWPPK